jgi:hypothetical protein
MRTVTINNSFSKVGKKMSRKGKIRKGKKMEELISLLLEFALHIVQNHTMHGYKISTGQKNISSTNIGKQMNHAKNKLIRFSCWTEGIYIRQQYPTMELLLASPLRLYP